MMHISTSETFMLDAPVIENCRCEVCFQRGPMEAGWVANRFQLCGHMYDYDDYPKVAKLRREWIGLSVDEMAKVAKVKRSTIRIYERSMPSIKYWDLTIDLAKKKTRKLNRKKRT